MGKGDPNLLLQSPVQAYWGKKEKSDTGTCKNVNANFFAHCKGFACVFSKV